MSRSLLSLTSNSHKSFIVVSTHHTSSPHHLFLHHKDIIITYRPNCECHLSGLNYRSVHVHAPQSSCPRVSHTHLHPSSQPPNPVIIFRLMFVLPFEFRIFISCFRMFDFFLLLSFDLSLPPLSLSPAVPYSPVLFYRPPPCLSFPHPHPSPHLILHPPTLSISLATDLALGLRGEASHYIVYRCPVISSIALIMPLCLCLCPWLVRTLNKNIMKQV